MACLINGDKMTINQELLTIFEDKIKPHIFINQENKCWEWTRSQISNSKRKHIKSGPFCSKECCGKFTREVQLKRREPKLELHYKNVTYYREKLV